MTRKSHKIPRKIKLMAVFKIMTQIARKWLVFPPHPCLTPQFKGNLLVLEFLDETYHTKLEEWGYCTMKTA